MKKKDICMLCEEYSAENKCDYEDKCSLIAMWKENQKLKDEVSKLKKELSDARLNMSYMTNPNAIGNRNDMGW